MINPAMIRKAVIESLKRDELFGCQTRLIQNASQGSQTHFGVIRYDCRSSPF